jgi:hypothetical protein
VALRGLISTQAAAELLAHLKTRTGPDAATARHPSASRKAGYEAGAYKYVPLSIDVRTGEIEDQIFFAFSHSPEMGDLGERLLGGPVRYWIDESFVKMPAGTDGSAHTAWHVDAGGQDAHSLFKTTGSPFDPPNSQIMVWIALNEVPAERGSMRFVARKDQDPEVKAIVDGMEILDSYRALERRGVISPPLNLRPGDATAHRGALHSSPPNATDVPRWGYIVSLFRADARYATHDDWELDGVRHSRWEFDGVEGLEVGQTFPSARFRELAKR